MAFTLKNTITLKKSYKSPVLWVVLILICTILLAAYGVSSVNKNRPLSKKQKAQISRSAADAAEKGDYGESAKIMIPVYNRAQNDLSKAIIAQSIAHIYYNGGEYENGDKWMDKAIDYFVNTNQSNEAAALEKQKGANRQAIIPDNTSNNSKSSLGTKSE